MEDGTKTISYKHEEEIDVKYIIDGKEYFQHPKALALLLLRGNVFLNKHWWEDEWREDCKKLFYIGVNCNDVFAWGCSDSEELLFDELKDLFEYWEKDPEWGTAVWCMIKRKEMPQKPVYDMIQKIGIWDLDKIKDEYALEDNYYDKTISEED